MPRGESFAPEMEPSPERAETESKLAKLGDQLAVVEKRIREASGPEEMLEAILEMQPIQDQMGALKAEVSRLVVHERLEQEGVEPAAREEAVEFSEKRKENAGLIQAAREEIKRLTPDLKRAEAELKEATTLELSEFLDALAKRDEVQALLTTQEVLVRRLSLENLSLASSLHTIETALQFKMEPSDFTSAETKWFKKGKKMSDFWEMEAAERSAMVDKLEDEFMAEAA